MERTKEKKHETNALNTRLGGTLNVATSDNLLANHHSDTPN